MQPMLNMAMRAARRAGDIISRAFEQDIAFLVERKGHNDFVTEIDRQAEAAIIDTLLHAYPEHGILAEESGLQEGAKDYQWIIDPLDGTTNFMHGFPHFAVSIGMRHKNRLEHAVIYDPLRKEMFGASRGDGAFLNNRRLRVTQARSLKSALLCTGFPFRDEKYIDIYLETFRQLLPVSSGVRRTGSAALDLAYVACGRFDGFWEFNLKPWDMAAGALLIQEAGGMVSDMEGSDRFLESGHIIAGTPGVFTELTKLLHACTRQKITV